MKGITALVTLIVAPATVGLMISWLRHKKDGFLIKSDAVLKSLRIMDAPAFYLDIIRNKGTITPKLAEIIGLRAGSIKPVNFFNKFDNGKDRLATLKTQTINERAETFHMRLKKEERSYLCKAMFLDFGSRTGAVMILFIKSEEPNTSKKSVNDKIDLAKALDIVPIPIWIKNTDGTLVYFNAEYLTLIENEECLDTLDPFKDYTISGKPGLNKKILSTKKHRKKYSILEYCQNPKLLIGVAIPPDIISFEDSSETYKKFLESLSCPAVIVDNNRRIEFCNIAFCSMFGLDSAWTETNPLYEEALDKMRNNDRLPSSVDFAQLKKRRMSIVENIRESISETQYIPDGTVLNMNATPGPNGSILISYEDITDRLTLERSAKEAAAITKSAMENIGTGIAVYSLNGRLTLSNTAFRNTWGISQEYASSMPLVKDICFLMGSKVSPNSPSAFARSESKEIFKGNKEKKKIEACGRVFLRSCSTLPDGSLMVSFDEITNSVKLETSLRERALFREHFFSLLSCQLREPLTAISGFTEMLISASFDGMSKEKRNEYLHCIKDSAEKINCMIGNMITSIRKYSRDENENALSFVKSTMHLTEIIEEISQGIRNSSTVKPLLSYETLATDHANCEVLCSRSIMEKVISKLTESVKIDTENLSNIKVCIKETSTNILLKIIFYGEKSKNETQENVLHIKSVNITMAREILEKNIPGSLLYYNKPLQEKVVDNEIITFDIELKKIETEKQ